VTPPGSDARGRARAPVPEVAVGAVVVVEDHLLLVRRGTDPEAGRWSIPGGRVEPGETLAAAVEREALEETGLVVRCGPLLGVAERVGPAHHFVILDFVAELGADPAPARPEPAAGGDAADCAWVRIEAVPAMELVSGLVGFLRHHGVLPEEVPGR